MPSVDTAGPDQFYEFVYKLEAVCQTKLKREHINECFPIFGCHYSYNGILLDRIHLIARVPQNCARAQIYRVVLIGSEPKQLELLKIKAC